jgi:hypothetical protein
MLAMEELCVAFGGGGILLAKGTGVRRSMTATSVRV